MGQDQQAGSLMERRLKERDWVLLLGDPPRTDWGTEKGPGSGLLGLGFLCTQEGMRWTEMPVLGSTLETIHQHLQSNKVTDEVCRPESQILS